MFNIIIAAVSALIPIGLVIFYFVITRRLNEPAEKDEQEKDEKK